MKLILVVTLLFMSSFLFAQDKLFVDKHTSKITFEKIIRISDKKSEELFAGCKEWFFADLNQTHENILGEVYPTLLKLKFIKTYTLTLGGTVKDKFSHNVILRIKEGAVKVTIDRIVAEPATSGEKPFAIETDSLTPEGAIRYTKRVEEIELNLNKFADQLETYLKSDQDF